MTRPSFPAVLDSSLIASFRSCRQKAFREYIEHWKPRTPSVHLHAGAAYAKGLEVARTAFYLDGKPSRESIELGLGALIKAYGAFECPPDSAKSLGRMAGAFEFYFSQYPLESDKAVPVMLPGGGRGIEFSFAEPIDRAHPETGDPLLYVGRMDMICEFAGGVFGEDDKTTSQLGASWSKQWDLRSQFTGYCVTGDVEVLTPAGWVRIDSLERGTPVMQWSQGALEFVVPSAYHKPQHVGPLHRISGKTSICCTPDHRILTYDAYSDQYKTFTAATLPQNSGSLRFLSAGWKVEGEILEEAAVRLMVAIQADGSWVRGADGKLLHVRFQFSKARKGERLLQLLDALGLDFVPWKTDNFSGKVNVCEILQAIYDFLGPDRLWGSWLLQFHGDSLRTLMDELRYWDGTLEDTLYSTSVESNADWIKTIAALCGIRASIHTQKAWKKDKPQFRVSYSESHQHSVHLHQHSTENFSGFVYCLTVPSSYFLIRHEGKISVTGNCWGAAKAGMKLDGFLVRGVSILKTKYDTLQAITYRPQWMIDRWYEQLLLDVDDMVQAWDAGYWDFNLDHACVEFGGCPFRQICLSEPASQNVWLETNFERRRWDPVTRLETRLESPPPAGYTAEELDRDNPHNAWMRDVEV